MQPDEQTGPVEQNPGQSSAPAPINDQPSSAMPAEAPSNPQASVSPSEEPVAPVQPVVPAAPHQPQSWSQMSAQKSGKKKITTLIVAVIALLVLLGGGAAAYFAVYLPSKPENIFKQAIANSLKQSKATAKGEMTLEDEDPKSFLKSAKVDFTALSDSDNNAGSMELAISSGGASLSVEARVVDGNVYLKLGDISELVSKAGTQEPGYAEAALLLNTYLRNQWIEFDSAFLEKIGASCFVDGMFKKMSEDDLKKVRESYENNQFAVIKDTAEDNANGQAAIRYTVEVDDAKLKSFAEDIENISTVGALKKCTDKLNTGVSIDEDQEAKTEMQLWVDKKTKNFTKVETKSKQGTATTTLKMTMSYGTASVAKPEDAKPFEEVLGDLGLLEYLSGGSF